MNPWAGVIPCIAIEVEEDTVAHDYDLASVEQQHKQLTHVQEECTKLLNEKRELQQRVYDLERALHGLVNACAGMWSGDGPLAKALDRAKNV